MRNVFLILLIFCATGYAYGKDPESSSSPDFKFLNLNLTQGVGNKIPFGKQNDSILNIEFGGRSGALSLFGFVDFYDSFSSRNSDRHGAGNDNFFSKLYPRLSVNSLTGTNLEVGAFKEFYVSGMILIGDVGLYEQYLGVGSDVVLPWLGVVSSNLMARFVQENFGAKYEGEWDGYLFTLNWQKALTSPENTSYFALRGFVEYNFGAAKTADNVGRSDSFLEWLNAISWNTKSYAVSYGLKYFNNMSYFKNGDIAGDTTGFGHYFTLTYKF